jgi:hypothetical protein
VRFPRWVYVGQAPNIRGERERSGAGHKPSGRMDRHGVRALVVALGLIVAKWMTPLESAERSNTM